MFLKVVFQYWISFDVANIFFILKHLIFLINIVFSSCSFFFRYFFIRSWYTHFKTSFWEYARLPFCWSSRISCYIYLSSVFRAGDVFVQFSLSFSHKFDNITYIAMLPEISVSLRVFSMIHLSVLISTVRRSCFILLVLALVSARHVKTDLTIVV